MISLTLEDISMLASFRDGAKQRYWQLTCKTGEPYYFNVYNSNHKVRKETCIIHGKKLILPKFYYRLGEECSICLESIYSERTGWKTNCGHIFHKQCLRNAFINDNEDCPLCRGFLGNIEFIDGIRYSTNESCSEKKFLDILEELEYMIPISCNECDVDLGMNKECKTCLQYRKYGLSYSCPLQ